MLTHRHLIRVQSPNIGLRWGSEQSAVLTAELGRTLISHEPACTARVEAATRRQESLGFCCCMAPEGWKKSLAKAAGLQRKR